MNQLFHIKIPIPTPFNGLFSTFVENRYRIPRLTKSVIIKNSTGATNEELRGVIQSLPLYRIFGKHLIDIIGSFDHVDTTGEVNSNLDVCVFYNLSHDASKQKIITLFDFKYYIIQQGKMIPYTPDSDLTETFFHQLDKVVVTKNTSVDLCFFACSNWTDLTNTFMGEEFLSLFDEDDKAIAMTEYQHIKPYFKNVHGPLINCWSTGAAPNNVLNMRFDFVETQREYWTRFLLWMYDNLKTYIHTQVKTLPNFLPEGKLSLEKTSTFSNLILYSILRYQNVECANNTINVIPKTELDINKFLGEFDRHIDNIKSAVEKALSNN